MSSLCTDSQPPSPQEKNWRGKGGGVYTQAKKRGSTKTEVNIQE